MSIAVVRRRGEDAAGSRRGRRRLMLALDASGRSRDPRRPPRVRGAETPPPRWSDCGRPRSAVARKAGKARPAHVLALAVAADPCHASLQLGCNRAGMQGGRGLNGGEMRRRRSSSSGASALQRLEPSPSSPDSEAAPRIGLAAVPLMRPLAPLVALGAVLVLAFPATARATVFSNSNPITIRDYSGPAPTRRRSASPGSAAWSRR
jgi:hypothetical protein